ncbi:MAG: HAMP domain-containing protein, partial [Deltaproteobacteria bacterium]|nr:HAMP domain-containing protein [Deltaproteobacteria bacterium]
ATDFVVHQPLHGRKYSPQFRSDVIGATMIVMDLAPTNARLKKKFLTISLAATFFVVAYTVVFVLIVHRLVVKPVNLLSRAISQLSAGNWKVKVPTSSRDEIGNLGRSFSRMAASLQEAEKHLENYSHHLEAMVEKRTAELEKALSDLKQTQSQLIQSEKLAAVGQLAAGIAHEINTPTQYVSDNTRFLEEASGGLLRLLTKYNRLLEAVKAQEETSGLVKEVEAALEEADLEYLIEEIPKAIEQSLEGLDRVASIVRAMKEFSHPDAEEKTMVDLNKNIENTITVARNEWKYVAEMETDLDPSLPLTPVLPGEFNQVVLNIIINAAQAIAQVVGDGSQGKGTITVATRRQDGWAEIRIGDSGPGIPEEIKGKIFDPFFTTKEVGQGTGQGLAIARSVIVDKHGGELTFETEPDKGTVFIIRLPLEVKT